MRVVIMDKLTFAINSMHDVTSITLSNGLYTIVGIQDTSGSTTPQTVTAMNSRYLIRIMES